MSVMPDSFLGRDPALPFAIKRMQVDDLVEVMAIENDVYPHPWTRGNFLDSLSSGYEIWTVRDPAGALAGYLLLMISVDDAHLLNIAVRRDLHLDGNRDVPLDLLGRGSRALRDDLNLRRHGIGIRFNVQLAKRKIAGDQGDYEKHNH